MRFLFFLCLLAPLVSERLHSSDWWDIYQRFTSASTPPRRGVWMFRGQDIPQIMKVHVQRWSCCCMLKEPSAPSPFS